MNLAQHLARCFATWPDLLFFEHEGRLFALTQQALDAAFDRALGEIHSGGQPQ